MSALSFSEMAHFRAESPRLATISTRYDLIGRRGQMAGVLRQHLSSLKASPSGMVLDIGAYDRAFGKCVEAMGSHWIYHSLDLDASQPHDFYSIDDVTSAYDVISMFELIEHLTCEEADKLLHKAYELLREGGCLLVSTPNPGHPNRYLADVTHRQHWPPHDLYAQLRHIGFASEAIRMYGVVYLPCERLQRAVAIARNAIWHGIGLEHRGGVLAIAVKDTNVDE